MRSLRLVFFAVATALRVLFRRLFRGRKLPQWSLRFEVVVEVARRTLDRGASGDGTGGAEDPLRTLVSRIPEALRAEVVLETRELGGLYTEVLTPRGWSAGDAVLFYLHGGGYATCSPRSHRALLARIAHESGARSVAVDYRKVPEHPFPAALDDARRAYDELLTGGVNVARLGIGGDSAGGGLALALMQRLRAEHVPLPAAATLLSPWVDLLGEGQSMVDNEPYDYLRPPLIPVMAQLYAGAHDRADPLISPVRADFSGLPPMLIQTGGAELFLSENQLLAERARAAGVEVQHEVEDGMIHVYQAFSDIEPRGRAAIRRIGAFLKVHLAAGRPGT